MVLQKIEPSSDKKERLETGPLQVGDDWPGIFIRGDQALFYSAALGAITTDDPIVEGAIEELQELLASCDQGNFEDS